MALSRAASTCTTGSGTPKRRGQLTWNASEVDGASQDAAKHRVPYRLVTRVAAGLHLSLDVPSRICIGLYRLYAVYDEILCPAGRQIEAPWPVAGLPEMWHVRRGSDIHGHAFGASFP